MSWYEVVAFCRWLSAKLGEEVQLPTEAEWERAAHGTDGREYPWGNGYRPAYANIDETATKIGPSHLGRTTAVGIYPRDKSPYGVQDMAGNIWVWCLNPYEDPESRSTEWDLDRALRGGSWYGDEDFARVGGRYTHDPGNRGSNLGFRLCRRSHIERRRSETK